MLRGSLRKNEEAALRWRRTKNIATLGPASATIGLAHNLKLQGIVIPTRAGTTSRVISANRPLAPCIGVCTNIQVCQKMALNWGGCR